MRVPQFALKTLKTNLNQSTNLLSRLPKAELESIVNFYHTLIDSIVT